MASCRLAWFVVSVTCCVQNIGGSDYVNVALGKPTKQINLSHEGYPRLAVDGNRNSNYDTSCTHTLSGPNNWWLVDLLTSYSIHSVAITNRDVLQERLQNFTIYVSNVNPLPLPPSNGSFFGGVCLHYSSSLPQNGPHVLNCIPKISGRFVYLFKATPTEALTICEFEVMVLKEDLNRRQQGFSVSHGKKTLSPPFYSQTINTPSGVVECVSVCLSATGGVATVIQLESASRTCQCVQTSGWDELSIAGEAGWILMH